jgi:hypothetical protein
MDEYNVYWKLEISLFECVYITLNLVDIHVCGFEWIILAKYPSRDGVHLNKNKNGIFHQCIFKKLPKIQWITFLSCHLPSLHSFWILFIQLWLITHQIIIILRLSLLKKVPKWTMYAKQTQYGVYAVTTKQDGSSFIRKVLSSRSRIPNGMTWNPLFKFLWAKRLKKYASHRGSNGRKRWNAQSKAAKPGSRRGRRARPMGLLLCPMQLHVKLGKKRSKLLGHFLP